MRVASVDDPNSAGTESITTDTSPGWRSMSARCTYFLEHLGMSDAEIGVLVVGLQPLLLAYTSSRSSITCRRSAGATGGSASYWRCGRCCCQSRSPGCRAAPARGVGWRAMAPRHTGKRGGDNNVNSRTLRTQPGRSSEVDAERHPGARELATNSVPERLERDLPIRRGRNRESSE
jgi:hypothetical protein